MSWVPDPNRPTLDSAVLKQLEMLRGLKFADGRSVPSDPFVAMSTLFENVMAVPGEPAQLANTNQPCFASEKCSVDTTLEGLGKLESTNRQPRGFDLHSSRYGKYTELQEGVGNAISSVRGAVYDNYPEHCPKVGREY